MRQGTLFIGMGVGCLSGKDGGRGRKDHERGGLGVSARLMSPLSLSF